MKALKVLGASLLVSCTTIGGGVLALPINTIHSGFIYTAVAFIICWLFMTAGALLLLEANLWEDKETNLISMATHTLGTTGKVVTWIIYLLLLYSLMSAYLTASNAWLNAIIKQYFNYNLPTIVNVPVLSIFIGAFIFFGIAITDQFNRILSIGLISSYGILVFVSLPHVDTTMLSIGKISSTFQVIPIIITTFGFSIIIPSLTNYLEKNVKHLLIAIGIGSIIPIICYLLWEYVILGTLSIPGEYGLAALSNHQANSTEVAIALEHVIGNPIINISARIFSISAILTSLIGISLSLFHFLSDGLKMPRHGLSGIKLFFITYIPPVIIVLFFPTGFDKILSFSSIFISILLGILPVMMVAYGRYKYNLSGKFRVGGGKVILILTALFFIYVIIQELINFLL